jgi:hypothetical protein
MNIKLLTVGCGAQFKAILFKPKTQKGGGMRSSLKFVWLLVMFFLSLALCLEVVASNPKGGKTLLRIEDRVDKRKGDTFQATPIESEEQAALLGEEDTLIYDDSIPTWAFPIPDEYGDDLFNVRFTPAWDYLLKSALFLFNYKIGNGAVRIYVWEDTSGFPAQKVDSVDVSHANIQLYPSWTTVNFSSKNVTLTNSSDFHIGYTPLGPPETDTLAIISDDGLPVGTEHRSIESWEGVWGTMFDDWGGEVDFNFMIRAVVEKTTGVAEEEFTVANPTKYELFQNHPNPFNPQTKIRYYLPEATWVNLTIYNLLGQRVRTLVDEYQNAGTKAVFWDGRDEKRIEVASGIYFHQLKTEEFCQTRKMVLLR